MQKTVILVETISDVNSNLVQFLHSRGRTVQVASGYAKLFELLTQVRDPVLVIDLGLGSQVNQNVEKILKLSVLAERPVVFMGDALETHDKGLSAVFHNCLPLSRPFTNADLLSAIDYVAESTPRHSPSTQEIAPPEIELRTVSPVPPRKPTKKQPTARSAAFMLSVPELGFAEIKNLKLLNKDFGSKEYVRASTPSRFSDQRYLPTNPEVLRCVEQICSVAGKRGASHIHRTSYLSHRMLEVMQIDPELLESARNASFLFSWGFASQSTLLLANYLSDGKTDLRRELAEKVSISARSIAEELKLSNEETIVVTIARLIGEDSIVEEGPLNIISSAIMAADLTDRVCWQRGFWDPRIVYSYLRKLKTAEVPDMHPSVLGCILAMLARSVSTEGRRFLVAQSLMNDPMMQTVIGDEQRDYNRETEMEMSLDSLTPGMRLTRPLRSFDGRTIIGRDVTLDEDLIWRIWQLSAIRPLNSAYVMKASAGH